MRQQRPAKSRSVRQTVITLPPVTLRQWRPILSTKNGRAPKSPQDEEIMLDRPQRQSWSLEAVLAVAGVVVTIAVAVIAPLRRYWLAARPVPADHEAAAPLVTPRR
ncbi:MAG TPA: hypothetical protein VFM37_15440 [Pseudonocardiaceae bacterium]|nr:hypothetical protein [Pseudonocardiaceae bacterium]